MKCDFFKNFFVVRWFMLFNVVFIFIIGLFFGWFVIKVIKFFLYFCGIIVGCCVVGNEKCFCYIFWFFSNENVKFNREFGKYVIYYYFSYM